MKQAVKVLRQFHRKNSFDAIAFTGTSGAALAYPLSYLLGVPLICVRKSIRDNHFGSKLEGYVTAKKYIIVDDFVQSGKTINGINKSIKLENKKANCVGIYLYDQPYKINSFKDIPVIKNV